ncbi:MAG TPA: glycoside hydrolase family 2 TIM barrel-domain containing protein [Armatimonadota bacterium]|nr:glycoside hydrolase family 2 TIM barrel-domain containing protein [Armatimonadota bacterium]HOS42208.1 glycoside hydrolase family 2 TIM barrel-domain containing protein [Armatimonadota bacterium]
MFTYGRPSIDLNGTWQFCPDPMQRCRSQQWWRTPPKRDSMFPCWDPAGLWEIQVPGTWKTQFDELKWYDGHAVYCKTFSLDEVPADREAFLVFDGIIYQADVFLNGQLVGSHEWGYSNFALRVTECLRAGENQLFVLVDSHLSENRVPGARFDWNNDGGIINPVSLVFTPTTYLENFRVQTYLDEEHAVIEVEAYLASRDLADCRVVTVRIPELGLEESVTVAPGTAESVFFQAPRAEITLWSPETPQLYRIELSTDEDEIADEVGFREVRTEGMRILLNGEPIRLYGLCTHAEFKDTGRAATPAGIDLLIAHAKELGVNFLRCAHYPYAAAWGRALDKAGILWWEEVPAYWLPNMGEDGQSRKACGMMAETIQRDWNRASLIIWSVSNECCYRNPDNPEENNYAYWFRVVPLVREMDPGRLISCAEAGNMIAVAPVWKPEQGDQFNRRTDESVHWRPGHTDEIYALFDIFAANMYLKVGEAGIAYRRYVEMLRGYNKPMILSEFGSTSLRGAQVPDDQLGSEANHRAVIRDAYTAFAEIPEISGYCPWCLVDVRAPIHWRWYNAGKGVFRYGFLDEHWEKKAVYDTLKDCIAQLKAHFAAKG